LKKKTDKNQKEIVSVLRQVGADVLDLSAVGGGCPDLVVAWRGENIFVEVKNPKTYGKLRESQKEFFERWRGKKIVVYTVDEALEKLGILQ